ncbi:alkane 1-monooxygenase [Pseudooceanicola sp.]|uniref:alkane 1-monooxygenase n=1 Tax=Pseudooceanicola sp. TaxID=1914328 RepID=UPI00261EA936|nr:alkane 1-monooxygenase [Pseudooceanicola sp.]MDF1854790.1 alkane 1-monooxygenase [Pseudooceanicola sp.]
MAAFTFATLLPLPLLLLAAALGGTFSWIALIYLTVLMRVLDLLLPKNWRNRNPQAEFPASKGLSQVLGIAHLWTMIAAIFWIGGPAGADGFDAAITALAFGLWFGQISHPNAHELIHRSDRQARQLGRLVYISMLFGHHASSHPKVHHIYVATPQDPSSARLGEGFWRFALRAWSGSFWAGLKAEHADLRRAGKSLFLNPYFAYIGGAALMLLIAYALAGKSGLAVFLGLSLFAHLQILLSDYVQHYGLDRAVRADGRYEPVGPQHSWNSPHAASGAMMLNAPRHSDHHMNPMRPYPALQLDRETMPILPYSLPSMAMIALVPGWWRRVMDDRIGYVEEFSDDFDFEDFGGESTA